MILYFSGLNSHEEATLLQTAGVKHILADWIDLPHIDLTGKSLAIDCGAYRARKRNEKIPISTYKYTVDKTPCDFAVALDVIGDAEQTYQNWINHFFEPPYIPVWGFGSPYHYLDKYLKRSQLVGIGALVPLMREKNEAMLSELVGIARQYPGRFHIFGCNWLKAIEELLPYAYSGDTSKWLDGGRYARLIFENTRTGRLSQAPARALGKSQMTRHERLLSCALAMNAFCNAEN